MIDESQMVGGEGSIEEKLINEEYKIWKRNTPFLYDIVMTHALEWPSLSSEWLPAQPSPTAATDKHAIQQLLLGTHTAGGEQNYLLVANVRLPAENADIDARQLHEQMEVEGTAPEGEDASKKAKEVKGPDEKDENEKDMDEVDAAASASKAAALTRRIEIVQRVPHPSEVNRARHMPQQPHVVASKGASPDVYVYNLNRHPKTAGAPVSQEAATGPDLVLTGHKEEGYGLSWSRLVEGHLLSGSDDGLIVHWDLRSALAGLQGTAQPAVKPPAIAPLATYTGHTAVVEDVQWSPLEDALFLSASDDKTVMLWDTRSPDTAKASHVFTGHEKDVNCVAWSPHDANLFVSGSADSTVALWDRRNPGQKLHSFEVHRDQVLRVEWSPHNETIIASCSADRRVNIWDLSRIGMEQSPEDQEDGPPELLFIHGGHTDKISDFSWSTQHEWVVSSVADNNILQVWAMAQNLLVEGEAGEADLE